MSYLPAARPVAVGGFFDPIRGASFSNAECFSDADAHTADMFAKQQDVDNNWNPTGFYTPDDMSSIKDAAFAMMAAAGAVLDAALNNSQDLTSRGQLMDARDAIFDQESKGVPFIDAVRNARAGSVQFIEATGFKRWVIGTIEVSKAAMFTAYYVACNRSPFLDLLIGVVGALIDASDFLVSLVKTTAGVAKAVVDAAISAGQLVIKVADNFKTIVTVTLITGAAVGAYWLWTKYGKKHAARANPRRRRRR